MPTVLELAAARVQWAKREARPKQIAPPGDWLDWVLVTGRGWGKTRTGAEHIAWQAIQNPGTRWAVVGPTLGDTRQILIEGESGLRMVLERYGIVADYNKSRLQFQLQNGSLIQGYGAEKPDRLRGPQHHGAWCDELASWSNKEAWDNLKLGLRLGEHPHTVVTTTPRPTPMIRSLVAADSTVATRGSTDENRDNLSPIALAELDKLYGGTRLGRQELLGEILEEAEGALWSHEIIDQYRVAEITEQIDRTAVGVDPAVSTSEDSDETGIIVASLGRSGTVYVQEDHSGRYTPERWAGIVRELDVDTVAVEVNQGGNLVASVLEAAGVDARIRPVNARQNKAARAEPVAVKYGRGDVRHVGTLMQLEDQMATWEPGVSKWSPDRVDALVWAVGELVGGVQVSPVTAVGMGQANQWHVR